MKNGESLGLGDMNCINYSGKIEPGVPGAQGAPDAVGGAADVPQSGKVFTIHLGSSPPPPDASPPPARPARSSVDSQYDPYQHRELQAPTTNAETLVHLLKGSLGTGILAMPNAFNNAGLIVGLVGTVFIGSLCTYCMHILIRTQYEMCRRLRVPVLSYPRTMQIALENGPPILRKAASSSGIVINIFLIVYQLGICCVYIMFVASNIKDVVDNWTLINVRLYMVMILVPLILLNYIRNLKLLAPFSTLANAITFVGLGITLYYVFDEMPNPLDRELFGSIRNIPLFIGTTLFALEAVGVIIALENNMKQPVDFRGYTGVLNRGMTVIVFLYVFMGFTGYVRYGDKVQGSITLNLDNREKLAQSVKIMFAIAIFITYALQCYVPVEIIWGSYISPRLEKSSPKMQTFWEYVLRTAIVLVTFFLAAAIPRLELFISLFGALCLSALGIIFPAIIELCYLWPRQAFGRYNWILVKDIFLLLCGIIALIIGTYTSLRDIIISLL